jgi:probable F420-dependent oxidoreductase
VVATLPVNYGAVRFGVLFLSVVDADLVALGRTAEELGFESLFMPEHTHCAVGFLRDHPEETDYYGGMARMFDPFVALAAVASVTRTLRLGTGICLVPQHDPIVLAKQVATLDRVSGGRLMFGIGAGWVPAEAAHHGVAFDRRFDVMRDYVLAMQALWTGREVSHAGEFVQFDDVRSLDPVQQPHPPILSAAPARRHALRSPSTATGGCRSTPSIRRPTWLRRTRPCASSPEPTTTTSSPATPRPACTAASPPTPTTALISSGWRRGRHATARAACWMGWPARRAGRTPPRSGSLGPCLYTSPDERLRPRRVGGPLDARPRHAR